jgi:signal transduction histidine kinase
MSARLLGDGRIGELNGEQKELVEGISGDTNRLLRITGELLNLTQAETGHIQLQRAAVYPGVIIQVAMEAVLFQARQKNIRIETDLQQGDLKVIADAEKSSWVLINYMSNAIRYSYEDGRIMLTVHPTPEGLMAFVVRDWGPGIEEKYLPRLFDKYFQVPGALAKSGSGLGLAICKEFIEAQGGAVHVWSRLGDGSAFSFELPVAG